jgi:hypothetical protein
MLIDKRCKQYWLNRGFDEETSIEKASQEKVIAREKREIKKSIQKEEIRSKLLKENKNIEEIKQILDNLFNKCKKEFWIYLKNYSEEEAINRVEYICENNRKSLYKGNRTKVKNLENELQFYIDQVIAEGFSGNYAIKLARERRKKDIKRLSPTSIELWTNKGMTEDEAKYYIRSKRPNFIEYWLLKGFSEVDAKIKVSEFQSNTSKCVKNIQSSTNIQYFIDRGFSPEEAKEKLK